MSRSTTSSMDPAQDHILPSTPRRRWTIVGLLFTASLINYFDRATISFALPLISTELHLGTGVQGRPALRVLLVVHADADPDGRARRSGEPALALRGRVHAVVGRAGPDGIRDRADLADRLARPARALAKRSTCPADRRSSACCFRRRSARCRTACSTPAHGPGSSSKASSFRGCWSTTAGARASRSSASRRCSG